MRKMPRSSRFAQSHRMTDRVRVQDKQAIPFVMIPRAFFRRYRPSWRAILAMNALKFYSSGQSGSCENISIRTLAAIADTSVDTIRRGIEELEEKKLLKTRSRSRKSAKGERIPLPNLYELQSISDAEDPI